MPNIAQIIQYEGNNQTFIWKHPTVDFNSGTQLIVHESQEAIFFMNGQALDLFGPGRYTLETQNIPLVRRALNQTTNGQTPFHCEVYFINKTEQMGIKWGTDSKVNYLDPNYDNYPFPVGASGQMNIRITDSRKLLVKVVGTTAELSQMTLASYFHAPMMTKIKSYLPAVLSVRAIPIFDVDQHMEAFSEDLCKKLRDEFSDYGIEVSKFWITAFVKPEDDNTYQRLKALRGNQMTSVGEARLQQQLDLIHQDTKAQKIVMEAQAMAQKRQIEGYSYETERTYDVAERFANNQTVGGIANAGIGLGMVGGVAGSMGAAMSGIISKAVQPAQPTAGKPAEGEGAQIAASQVQDEFGTAISDFELRLKKLEMLKGKIPDEQYQAKIQEICDSI